MNKKIIITILIILLAALAVFAFEKYKPSVTSLTPSPSVSATSSKINPNWSQYQDAQDGFFIAFPPDYLLTQNIEVPASDISLGVPVATINLPESYFAGTNLGEASLTIRIGTSSAEVASCVANSQYFAGQRQINDETFAQYNFIGAAAGNIYDSLLLRNSHENKCYEIELLMHSGNIANYTPGTVKEFNRDEILGDLKQIADTFKFISSASTSPGISALIDVTLVNNNTSIQLKQNQSFLLNLGDGYNWNITMGDETIIKRRVNVTVIKGAQGIYDAFKPGQTTLNALGDPSCRQSQPACALPSIVFRVSINVID